MKKFNWDWNQYAAIAAVVGTIIAAIALIPLFMDTVRSDTPQIIVAPLPTGLPPTPTPTPKPTVVGTPIPDFPGIAVIGRIGFITEANNISFVVDEVQAYLIDPDRNVEISGYSKVVVKLRVTNNNENTLISPYDITLVDDFSNEYVHWNVVGFEEFPRLPAVMYQESAAGALVYRVPIAALNNQLRVRLEDTEDISLNDTYTDTRIEIMLDPIPLTQP